MAKASNLEGLWAALAEYQERLEEQLPRRWEQVPVDLSKREVGEVCAALLSRQTRLGIEFARSPSIWNGHIAPVLLRSMVDLLINLKWVLQEPTDRARKFILYGLGQAKLEIEHRRVQLEEEGYKADDDPVIETYTSWINGQRFTFLTEVDVGSWSGSSVRDMAKQADCVGLLTYAYAPFSAATHSMWHHVGRYNVVPCASALHRHHMLPWIGPDEADLHYLDISAKYVERAFEFYEAAFDLLAPDQTAYDWLLERIDELGAEGEEDPGPDEDMEPRGTPTGTS